MKIKKDFYINGHLWRVEYKWALKDDEGNFCHGLTDTKERVIWLDRATPRDEKWHWFLHELFHAFCYESHLSGSADGAINDFQEGLICEAFPKMMNELFNMRWKRGI